MPEAVNQSEHRQTPWALNYPALAALGLTEAEFPLLRTQGSVSSERRENHTYFKLRYRVAGAQHVRSIGADNVALVRAELQRLQAGAVAGRQLRADDRQARRLLRTAKRTLTPLLADSGFHFTDKRSGNPVDPDPISWKMFSRRNLR